MLSWTTTTITFSACLARLGFVAPSVISLFDEHSAQCTNYQAHFFVSLGSHAIYCNIFFFNYQLSDLARPTGGGRSAIQRHLTRHHEDTNLENMTFFEKREHECTSISTGKETKSIEADQSLEYPQYSS